MTQLAAFGYALCAAAFLVVTALAAVSRTQSRYKTALLIASALTALWSAIVFVRLISGSEAIWLDAAIDVLEHSRTLGWMAAITFVMFFAYGKRFEPTFTVLLASAIGAAVLYLAGFEIYVFGADQTPTGEAVRFNYIARVILSVSGGLLIENLFRNSGSEARWAVKTLCFGVGTILSYDFLLYAEAALFGRIDGDLFAARGFVNALAAPLVVLAAARSKKWPIDLHVSRKLVFHSATLLGAGGYLVVISGVSYYFTTTTAMWSTPVRIVFIAAAVLGLALFLTSAAIQTRIKDFITRNFFSYKYDYRGEWLKFIDAISTSSSQLGIPDRIVRAIGNIVGSTAGALWIYRDEDHAYQPAANWNMGEVLPSFTDDDRFVGALKASGAVLNLQTLAFDGAPGPTASPAIPEWLSRHPRAWLAMALPHGDDVPAIAILGRRRVEAALTWEDYELLKTAARQAASYVAEEQSGVALTRARRFEDFNRQFAFVVHDLKNLAGQMTLILKNSDRHGDDPEFQKDVMATIRDSVARMHTMLHQLREGRQTAGSPADTDLAQTVRELATAWQLRNGNIQIEAPSYPVHVKADAQRISAIANHLVQNAVDASGQEEVVVRVTVGSPAPPDVAVLSIADRGPGMDRKFIEERLFQPLESTKATGYGIGAFQARQLAREVGGRLTVQSALGQGTTMTVEFPLARGPVDTLSPGQETDGSGHG